MLKEDGIFAAFRSLCYRLYVSVCLIGVKRERTSHDRWWARGDLNPRLLAFHGPHLCGSAAGQCPIQTRRRAQATLFKQFAIKDIPFFHKKVRCSLNFFHILATPSEKCSIFRMKILENTLQYLGTNVTRWDLQNYLFGHEKKKKEGELIR